MERTCDMTLSHINWYPGHMKKTRDLIRDNLKMVDAAVEVVDARIPVSSRNPIIDDLLQGKIRILAFNKSDLADETATKEWIRKFNDQGIPGPPAAQTSAYDDRRCAQRRKVFFDQSPDRKQERIYRRSARGDQRKAVAFSGERNAASRYPRYSMAEI
jgi:ribosome biogenesis GTPase A